LTIQQNVSVSIAMSSDIPENPSTTCSTQSGGAATADSQLTCISTFPMCGETWSAESRPSGSCHCDP